MTPEYHEAKRNGTLNFGKVEDMRDGIIAALDTVFDPSSFKPDDGRKPKAAKFQKDNFDKKEFQDLWKRINQKTYYQVNFDTTDLIKKSIKALDDNLKVTEIRIVVEGGSLDSWAVAFREGSVKHVYFVAESKGNDLEQSQLRGSEESKIECARRHFKAISDNGYIYDVVKDYKSLYNLVTK